MIASKECDDFFCVFSNSPNRSATFIPNVPNEIRPVVGSTFKCLDDGIRMYDKYALSSGFDVRRGTQKTARDGSIRLKYLFCSKEGLCKSVSVDTLNTKEGKECRSTNTSRTGCGACVKFKLIDGSSSYILYHFEERHNHRLIKKDNMHLSKGNRQLDYSEKLFLHRVSSSNVGASQAHKMISAFRGGYSLVSGTQSNFKNMRRDLNCYVGDSDAQMVVEKLSDRKKYVTEFSFEYKTHEGELVGLFWADQTSKCNYGEFGDVVSFDATYQTNKYNMVFVPFTGVDNHRNCVSFGAGLIKRETVELYTWLLGCFLSAFKKQPRLIVTDQDPAMKIAVDSVFTQSRHRLCMWHIGMKLSAKVSSNILNHSDFKKRFHNLIWDMHLDTADFEMGWPDLINEFGLEDHRWFRDMFSIRQRWVSCYFKDVLLCGLMRTTSRSESENSFFNHFMYPGSTLISFMSCFETAMEKQRHKQNLLDHQTSTTSPIYKTPLDIERQASKLYTRKVFRKVQEEIFHGVWSCVQISVKDEGGEVVSCCIRERRVKDSKQEKGKDDISGSDSDDECEESSAFELDFKVSYGKKDNAASCSCMMFTRLGILCRHVFCVYRSHDVQEIPIDFIARRWTRDIVPSICLQKPAWYGEDNRVRDNLYRRMHSIVDDVFLMCGEDVSQLESFFGKMEKLKDEAGIHVSRKERKRETIKKLVGCEKPDSLSIQNPSGIRNKGCGSSKRMVSQREKAIIESHKPKRMCKNCKQLSNHDSRNCPLKATKE